ncbi:CoA ester lyase [Salinibacterium sp. NK8237]|uniref:HpcH/HpaI aldolase/citrate lyase family protein n=1 Tax=Salinibacterium sp. NK8237 TaxID=2792038 RepID=UPI0035A949B8
MRRAFDALTELDVIALCETARGVLAATSLAALDCVVALMWGAEDVVASLGGSSSRENSGPYRGVALHACSSVLLAAGAYSKALINAVHLDIADVEGLGAEARDAAALGFTATACSHPSQVAIVRESYAPTVEQIASARARLAAAESQPGVFSFEGRTVDGPILRHAECVVARAGLREGQPFAAVSFPAQMDRLARERIRHCGHIGGSRGPKTRISSALQLTVDSLDKGRLAKSNGKKVGCTRQDACKTASASSGARSRLFVETARLRAVVGDRPPLWGKL